MTNPSFPVATLRPKEERRIIRGHLWIYRNEFQSLPQVNDGDVIDVYAANRRFIGRAFYQAAGGIAARIIHAHQHPIDEAFFHERLLCAHTLRQQLFSGSTVYRWVHGESDLLPGLVIDRYASTVIVSTSCAFYENRKDALRKAILQFDDINSLCWVFNDVVQWDDAPCDATAFEIDGLNLALRFGDTQKTGLFLDQRANWPLIRKYAADARVLDGYCYHGLWSLHAALGGAASVLGVDSSATAIEQARDNSQRNGLDHCTFERGDVQQVLACDDQYGVIVLDPPAFAKHRSQVKRAATQYETVNVAAMSRIDAGGILITCSCSHFISSEFFLEILKRAARRSGRKAQLLGISGAAPDHPVLVTMPETSYLKCVVARIL